MALFSPPLPEGVTYVATSQSLAKNLHRINEPDTELNKFEIKKKGNTQLPSKKMRRKEMKIKITERRVREKKKRGGCVIALT